MATSPTPPPGGSSAAARPRRERAKLVAVAILAVAATLFAVLNLDQVKVHLLFGSPRMPLILAIVICVLVGIAIGWTLARRPSGHGVRRRRP